MSEIVMLLRRDHEELEDLVARMLDPSNDIAARRALLDTLRSRFTAHAAAHGTVFQDALPPDAPARLRAMMSMVFAEHREQAMAIAALGRVDPGLPEWPTMVEQLQQRMFEHARAEDLVRASFSDHVAPEVRRTLDRGYVTERMRRLSTP